MTRWKVITSAMAAALALGGCATPKVSGPEATYLDGYAAAERAASPFAPVTAVVPGVTMEQAYGLQDRLVARRVADGDRVAGFKGGLMSAKSLADRGVSQPLTAPLFASGDSSGVVSLCGYRSPIFELKLGFIFGRPVTRRLASVEELRAAVASVQPVIDLPDIGYANPNAYGAIDMVAANISSARYVRGAPHAPGSIDLDALEVRLQRDGMGLARGVGRESLGDQWRSLLTLVNLIVDRGGSIAPGQFVITGKIGDKGETPPGEYVADYGPLGEVRFATAACNAGR